MLKKIGQLLACKIFVITHGPFYHMLAPGHIGETADLTPSSRRTSCNRGNGDYHVVYPQLVLCTHVRSYLICWSKINYKLQPRLFYGCQGTKLALRIFRKYWQDLLLSHQNVFSSSRNNNPFKSFLLAFALSLFVITILFAPPH